MKRDKDHLKKYFLLFLIVHLTACSFFEYDTPVSLSKSETIAKKTHVKKTPLQKPTNTKPIPTNDNIPVVNLMD